MPAIHKQLLTDEDGQPVGVLIPYQDWLRIEQELIRLEDTSNAARLQRYAGVLRLKQDPLDYQRQCREEWT